MKSYSERDRVAGILEKEIVFGVLKPRERLVEQDIMDRLDTRRHVVRTALDALENKMLVERRANKGATVRDLSELEIYELYFMRELLHRTAAEQTSLPLSNEVLTELRQIQSRHDSAIKEGDLSETFHQNEAFHAVLNHACGNNALEDCLNLYNERTNLVRSYAFRSLENLHDSATEHHEIIEAGAQGDRNTFIAVILKHVLRAKSSYLENNNIG